MAVTFTTELGFLGEQAEDRVKSWCQSYLTSTWKLSMSKRAMALGDGIGWGWYIFHSLTVSTPEDHALVQLTWL